MQYQQLTRSDLKCKVLKSKRRELRKELAWGYCGVAFSCFGLRSPKANAAVLWPSRLAYGSGVNRK
jgi:hypothetical protein